MTPQAQGGNLNLQGGTGISVGGTNPQGGTNATGISVGGPKLGTGTQSVNDLQSGLNQALARFQSSQAATQSLIQQSLAASRAAATPAPVLNYQSILANAQAQASNPNSQVNQLYQSRLNQYLQNAAAQQKLAEQQRQQSITGAQNELANTQAQLGQQQEFTGKQT